MINSMFSCSLNLLLHLGNFKVWCCLRRHVFLSSEDKHCNPPTKKKKKRKKHKHKKKKGPFFLWVSLLKKPACFGVCIKCYFVQWMVCLHIISRSSESIAHGRPMYDRWIYRNFRGLKINERKIYCYNQWSACHLLIADMLDSCRLMLAQISY